MITLRKIDENNFLEVCSLCAEDGQTHFAASASVILARAYAYRGQRARAFAICKDTSVVGVVLVEDMDEEPACYHLAELLIDRAYQRKGYAHAALLLLLNALQAERKYPRVELCVKKANTAAIRLYTALGFANSGYTDPATPDCLCMVRPLRERFSEEITIKETDASDLENVQRLWATPDVMRFVGFPNGLHETIEHLQNEWLPWVIAKPQRCHYSVYCETLGYCGESFYDVDVHGLASMDIKLLPAARGKGIAEKALTFALNQAFTVGNATAAWVDPDPRNKKALTLYARMGFREAPRPAHMEPYPNLWLKLTREDWEACFSCETSS